MAAATEAPVVPARSATSAAEAGSGTSEPADRWPVARGVVWFPAFLVVAQLAVRGWVAARGNFFGDDLILEGRAAGLPLFSAEFLLYDHNGHLMPGGFLLAGGLTDWWPLQWWAPALSLVLLQALASLAVLRLLRLLLGDRPVLLVPLALYLFSPLTLPGFAWWAAAVYALPLQAGLAWVAGDAVLLVRTGRRRYAVTGTIAIALSLAFFAKAVIVPLFALALAVLMARAAGDPTPLRSMLRRAAPLWVGSLGVTAVWVWAYTSLVGSPVAGKPFSVTEAAGPVVGGVVEGVLPALLGGPWQWYRTTGSPTVAAPPVELVAVACAVWLAVIVTSCRRRRGAWLIWLLAAGHIAFSATLMVAGRFAEGLADVVSLALRHFSDSAVVVAVAVALILLAPARDDRPARPLLTPRGWRLLVPAAVGLFVVSSLWSTLTFAQRWTDLPAGDYLANARASLAAAGPAPLLDQAVAEDVLWGVAHPANLASNVLAPLEQRPPFATWTSELRLIDESGTVVPARLGLSQVTEPGPVPDCGHLVSGDAVTPVPLEDGVYAWPWTVQLDYFANRDGVLQVSLGTGEAVRTPVQRGPHRVFLRLEGGGEELRLHSPTRDLALCMTGALIGLPEADDPNG